jgi:hypothetical protein
MRTLFAFLIILSGSITAKSQSFFNASKPIASQFRFENVTEVVIPFDYDGDSDEDILVGCNGEYAFFVYENNGAEEFFIDTSIQTSLTFVTNILTADLNGDTLKDIIILSNGNNKSIRWHQNLGNGNFGPELILLNNASASLSLVRIADIDYDSDLDILFNFGGNSIRWFKNDGDGNFIDNGSIFTGSLDQYEIKDMNGDGFVDLVVVQKPLTVYFKNQGNGVFNNQTSIFSLGGTTPRTLYIHDADSDGDIDVSFSTLIYYTSGGGYWRSVLYYVENLGNGIFNSTYETVIDERYALGFIYWDIDENGFTDILAFSSTDTTIYWYPNNGDANFSVRDTLLYPAINIRYFNTADLNNDGNLDLLTSSNGFNQVAWYKNLGGLNFTSPKFPSNIVATPNDLAFGDLDNDGTLDILVAAGWRNIISYIRNLGDLKFGNLNSIVHTYTIPASGYSRAVHISDLDGDGNNDIIYGYDASSFNEGDGKIVWLKNNGFGEFIEPIELLNNVTNYVWAVSSADLDNDGDMDIIASIDSKVLYFKNNGSGLFDSPIEIMSINVGIIETIDIDNNGTLELLLGTKLVRYLGNNQFSTPTTIPGHILSDDKKFTVDYDNDGFIDIMSGISSYTNSNGFGWSRNLQNGTFDVMEVLFRDSIDSFVPGDFDNDGDIDVASSKRNGDGFVWYENFNNDTFSTAQLVPLNIGTDDFRELYAVDMDEDGDLDLISTYYSNGISSGNIDFRGGVAISENLLGDTLTTINGKIYWDKNEDNIFNGTDEALKGLAIILQPGNLTYYSDLHGNYTIFATDTGNYTITVEAPFVIDCQGPIEFTTSSSPFNFQYQSNLILNNDIVFKGPTPDCRKVSGRVFDDINSNGQFDNNERYLNGKLVNSSQAGTTFSNQNGRYNFYIPNEVEDTISINSDSSYIYFGFCSAGILEDSQTYPLNNENHNINISTNDTTNIDFGVYREFYGNTNLRISDFNTYFGNDAGQEFRAWIEIRTIGLISEPCTLRIKHSPLLTLTESSLNPTSSASNFVEWIFPAGSISEIYKIQMEWYLDSTAIEGDTLNWEASYSCSNLVDNCPYDNSAIRDVLITSGPLRIASENVTLLSTRPEGIMPQLISSDAVLSYMLNFQNPLSTTAYNVIIIDTLSKKLNINSISNIFSSYEDYDIRITNDGVLIIELNGINLSNAAENQLNSYGFVQFNIALKNDVEIGDSILNNATVYFNGTVAIVSNEVIHIVHDFTPPTAACFDSLLIYLDENGLAFIDASSIDNGSSDNVEIVDMTISETNFDCDKIGISELELIVMDNIGNQDSCFTIVTVLDTIKPEIYCNNISVELMNGETISILDQINAFSTSDNCGVLEVVANKIEFTDQDIGNNQVEITIEDENGNFDTCLINVKVTILTNILESFYGINSTLSPNPTSNSAVLNFSKNLPFIYSLELFNAKGQSVISYLNLNQKTITIEKGDLNAGIYFLRIKHNEMNQVVANYKLIFH